MQERTENNIGVGTKRAKHFTYEDEQDLWKRGFLGHDTPDKLHTTAYYVIGMGFFLQERYGLRRDVPGNKSQISFESNARGVWCVMYHEDACTKTYKRGPQWSYERAQGSVDPP